MADKKPKPKKPSFRERMVEHGRDAKHLGKTLKDEPESFPREVGGIVRRSLRRVWDARGGGLYACGFVITFLYLETKMLVTDIAEAESVGGFFTEQATEMVFRYMGESIQNTVQAFIWPVKVIQLDPEYGIVALVAAFFLFDRFLKTRIEKWLFDDDESQRESA
ncbi:MAG: hypothetical protein OEM63_02590 [Gammaproteobacteria bacterium]|nr:hypothetical protein [Gammaproteobacteria bacterium]